MNTIVEIPFGTKDSELKGWEYIIPEGMEAVIENGKVIIREKESEDEKMMRVIGLALTDVPEERFTSAGTTLKDCLDYHEKHKENVKLEDSWHKVADSFPDNTREVICKDAIGNFFIGRYYKGSKSWVVSMYDDADKSNEDNPPVVMWCDIPSEKQQDQKPSEQSDEDERMWDKILNHFDWSFKGPYLSHEECDEIKAFLI